MNEFHLKNNTEPQPTQSRKGPAVSRTLACLAIGLAYLAGMGSFLTWLLFLVSGPLHLVPLRMGEAGIIGLNMGLSLLFFLVHSGMIRVRFRRWLGRHVREEFHGALYTIASGLVLFAVSLCWQESTLVIFEAPEVVRWAMYMLFALSLCGIVVCTRAFEDFDMCGVAPLVQLLQNKEQPTDIPFTVRGPYRWVRHPFYLFSILLIWASPQFSADRLLFNIMWTAWVIIGTVFEERDLTARFGDRYRDYQKQVPMLLPKSIHPAVPEFISCTSGDAAPVQAVHKP